MFLELKSIKCFHHYSMTRSQGLKSPSRFSIRIFKLTLTRLTRPNLASKLHSVSMHSSMHSSMLSTPWGNNQRTGRSLGENLRPRMARFKYLQRIDQGMPKMLRFLQLPVVVICNILLLIYSCFWLQIVAVLTTCHSLELARTWQQVAVAVVPDTNRMRATSPGLSTKPDRA